MKRPKKIGLVFKLTYIISLLLLITVGLICAVSAQAFSRAFLEETLKKLQTSLDNMQNNIDVSLDNAESILDELMYSREFPYFLDGENTLSTKEMQYYISNLDKYLVNIRYLYKNKYSDLGIYSSNKQINEQQYEWQFYLDDFKKQSYYNEIIADTKANVYGSVRERRLMSSTLNTKNLKMGDSGIRILPIYRKVYPINSKELIGVIEMDVDVARLTGKDALSEDNEIGNFLFDDKYNVLFDTMSLAQNDKAHVADMVRNQATGDVEIKGDMYLYSSSICARTGLISVAVSSKQEIKSQIRSQGIQIILISITCWGILVLIIFVFVKNTLKRLVVFDQMMGRIGEGDFTVEILEDRSGDEITRITRSFNKMAGQLEKVLEDKVKNEQAQKEAELRALQAQINPHFLYNTLENMRMQCEIDEYYPISNSLSALSNLFRYSVRWGSNEAPFQLEWENLKDYLNIMKMRFGEDVIYDLYCEPGLNDIIVPKLVLQPLVENCFNHGFRGKLPTWQLKVKAVKVSQGLRIIIRDNGVGIEPEQLWHFRRCLKENKPFYNDEQKKNSIGIANVKQRIDMVCKIGSALWIDSELGKGTKIEINIVC